MIIQWVFLYSIAFCYASPSVEPESTTKSSSDLDVESQDQVAILKQINRVNEDGSYTFGYEAADGSFKIETRDVAGNVKGMFGFVDDGGDLKRVSYTATNGTGFQSTGAPDIPPIVTPASDDVEKASRVTLLPTKPVFIYGKPTTEPIKSSTPNYISLDDLSTAQPTKSSVIQSIRPKNGYKRVASTKTPSEYGLLTSGTEDSPDVYGSNPTSRPLPASAYRSLFSQVPQHQRILQNAYQREPQRPGFNLPPRGIPPVDLPPRGIPPPQIPPPQYEQPEPIVPPEPTGQLPSFLTPAVMIQIIRMLLSEQARFRPLSPFQQSLLSILGPIGPEYEPRPSYRRPPLYQNPGYDPRYPFLPYTPSYPDPRQYYDPYSRYNPYYMRPNYDDPLLGMLLNMPPQYPNSPPPNQNIVQRSPGLYKIPARNVEIIDEPERTETTTRSALSKLYNRTTRRNKEQAESSTIASTTKKP